MLEVGVSGQRLEMSVVRGWRLGREGLEMSGQRLELRGVWLGVGNECGQRLEMGMGRG